MSYGLRGCDGRVHGLGAAYSEPGVPIAISDGRFFVTFINPNGTSTRWFSNWDTVLPSDVNFVSPPPDVWATLGIAAQTGPLQQLADQLAWQKQQEAAQQQAQQQAPAAQPSGGTLTFTTSRGGVSLYVGDTWLVSIVGASPNSPVTVSGSMPGGSFSGTPMGSTDANGNFSKSGTVGTGEIGSWSEQWAVGGVSSGSFSFTVAAVPASGPVIPKTPPVGGGPSPDLTAGSTTVGDFDLSKIPWWGWGLAAGAALFAFGGGRGR